MDQLAKSKWLNEQKMYSASNDASLPIFTYIAENLRSELHKFSSGVEYAQITGDLKGLDGPKYSAQAMLKLIECYLDYIDQVESFKQTEPVSLSALLSSVMSSMSGFANWQQCDLDLQVMGKYQPVMANREVLKTVLTSLSSILILAQSEIVHRTRPVVTFVVRKTKAGISAGIYSSVNAIDSKTLKTARQLYGKPGNPTSKSLSNGSAGLFMADSLLGKMSNGLKVSKFNNMQGLSANFEVSQQIALV